METIQLDILKRLTSGTEPDRKIKVYLSVFGKKLNITLPDLDTALHYLEMNRFIDQWSMANHDDIDIIIHQKGFDAVVENSRN